MNRAYTFKSPGGGRRVADLRSRAPSNQVSRRTVAPSRSSSAGKRVTASRRSSASVTDARRASRSGGVVRSIRPAPQARERSATETRRTYPAREAAPSRQTTRPRVSPSRERRSRSATPSRRARPAPQVRRDGGSSPRSVPRNRSARPGTPSTASGRSTATRRGTEATRGRAAPARSATRGAGRARVTRPSASSPRGGRDGARSARPARPRPSATRGRGGGGRSVARHVHQAVDRRQAAARAAENVVGKQNLGRPTATRRGSDSGTRGSRSATVRRTHHSPCQGL